MPNTSTLTEVFQGHEIRIVKIDGEPWFVAKDVCDALGLSRTHSGMRRLDEDEKGLRKVDTPGGPQEMTVISERSFQHLVLTSRKPAAKVLAKAFGLDVNWHKVTCVEAAVAYRVKQVFAIHRIREQKQIGVYRADLFFPDFDLVVEVDEGGHSDRNQIYEAQRDAFMKGSRYTVLRYDPDSEPVEVLYASIHEHIFNYQ